MEPNPPPKPAPGAPHAAIQGTSPGGGRSLLRVALFSARARRAWGLLLLLLTAWILWMALTPQPVGPSLPWDKANHALAFAVLSLCGHFALREQRHGRRWLVLGLCLLGVGIEWAQLYVPGRSSELADLVGDGVGVVLGLALASAASRRLDRRRQPRAPGAAPPPSR